MAGLDDAARLVAGPRGRRAATATRRAPLRVSGDATPGRSAVPNGLPPADLADIRGQPMARWALEVALAGGHDLLLLGSPGAGKTLLARTIPGLLPPLDDREAQEVAVIRSVAGLRADAAERHVRPFRAPHHTTSYAAMVGGGRDLLPGLVTQAHLGVLFLDELAEFDRGVLDALRQPLEDGTVEIVRAHGHVRYPARLQLIAAMNPCRCGWHGSEDRTCRCGAEEADRYVRRVSGPLLDRIDMRVSVPRVAPEALLDETPGEPSAVVAARIATARERALGRSGVTNGRLAGAVLLDACRLGSRGRQSLTHMASTRAMTARGIHRALRVARTIADLAGHEGVGVEDLAAAVTLREDGAGRLAA